MVETYEQALDSVLEKMFNDGSLDSVLDVIQNSVEFETALWNDKELKPIEMLKIWIEKAIWNEPEYISEEAIALGQIVMETVKRVTQRNLQYEVIPDYSDIDQGDLTFYLIIATEDGKIVPRPHGCLYWYCSPSSLNSLLALIEDISQTVSKH